MIPASSDALHHPHQEVAVTTPDSKPTEKTLATGFLPGEVGRLLPLLL